MINTGFAMALSISLSMLGRIVVDLVHVLRLCL